MTRPPPIRRQCQHIKDDAERCRKNCLPGKPYCNMASHRRAACLWRTRIMNFGVKLWAVIMTCFALVVAVPALNGYLIRISVAPYSTVRSHEPMGTVFNVTNNGVFDLHSVTQSCDLMDLKDMRSNQFFQNVRLEPSNYELRDLPAGATKSLPCEYTAARFPRRRQHRDSNHIFDVTPAVVPTLKNLSVLRRTSRRWNLGVEGSIGQNFSIFD